ncbi:MAG: hypothetical protein FJX37_02450 [Alphaproteobacteria bacterium]|nr:hypothetical protein [Alphaproteobacteria bacterium]MBM3951094.1 hypothetical protein [Rhodospirillales bacterium]
MASALDIVRDEHRDILRILHMLEDLAEDETVLARGIQSGLIASIVQYLWIFPYAIHHPKEEKGLFPALTAKDGGTLVATIAELIGDHAKGYRLLREIENAMLASGAQGGITRLRTAIRDYVDHKRRHIEREEREILPAVERILDVENHTTVKKTFADLKIDKNILALFESLFPHRQKEK